MNKIKKFGLICGAVGWLGMFMMSEVAYRLYRGAKTRVVGPRPPGDFS